MKKDVALCYATGGGRGPEKPVKILHVYKDYDPPVKGGVEGHIAMMCRYQQGWAEVEALVCGGGLFRARREIRDGTPVTAAAEWGRLLGAPVAPGFPGLIRRFGADVVVAHSPNPTGEIGCLLAGVMSRTVVRYHSDVVRQALAMRAYGPVFRAFLRRAAVILPTSQAYLDTSPWLQEVRERCVVVPLGIETEAFECPNPERVAALRRVYGEPFVLFAGRHRYYKGLSILIRAAARISAAVVIAGDGPEREPAMAQAAALGLKNTFFPGALPHEELKAHYHACAVVAFPSVARSEAFGLTILEAHACGRPVVATRLGTGVEWANLDGVTGLNVPPGDEAALAEALNRLLGDGALRERLGAAARQRVRETFHVSRTAQMEYAVYRAVAEGRLPTDVELAG